MQGWKLDQDGIWLVAYHHPNVARCPSYLLVASCVIADLGVGMCGRRRLPWVTWPSADFRVVASLAAGHEPAATPPVCGKAVSCLGNPATGERPGRACPGYDVKLPAKHTKSQKRMCGRLEDSILLLGYLGLLDEGFGLAETGTGKMEPGRI